MKNYNHKKTLNKIQEELKTESRKNQLTENELKMKGKRTEKNKDIKSRKYKLTIMYEKSTIRASSSR